MSATPYAQLEADADRWGKSYEERKFYFQREPQWFPFLKKSL